MDAIVNVFLAQHMTSPTRYDAVLDFVVTFEPDMINMGSNIGYLGNIDPCVLQSRLVIGLSEVHTGLLDDLVTDGKTLLTSGLDFAKQIGLQSWWEVPTPCGSLFVTYREEIRLLEKTSM